MKILLVSPHLSPVDFEHHGRLEFPRSLAVLAAAVRAGGHNPTVLDMPALNLWLPQLSPILRQCRPDLVGIPVHGSPAIPIVARHIACINDALPGTPVVIGGLVPSILGEQLFETLPSPDFIVLNDGEDTLTELADALEQGVDPRKIPGLISRIDGKMFQGPPRALDRHLDRSGVPAYDLLPMDRYRDEGAPVWLETKRGCPYRCRFCSVNTPSSYGTVRYRDPDRCVDEIEHVVQRYGITRFAIADDTFNLKPQYARKFCQEILRRGLRIEWNIDTRADCLDPDILGLMSRAGCSNVMMGVEVGSDDGLLSIQKSVSRERLIEAFHMVRAAGMRPTALLITGLPGVSQEDFVETARFIQEADPYLCNIFVFHPIPGAEYFHEPEKHGLHFSIRRAEDWRQLHYFSEPICDTPQLARREIIEHFVQLNYASASYFDKTARPEALSFLAGGPYPRLRPQVVSVKVGSDYVYYHPDGPNSHDTYNVYANVFKLTRFQYEVLLFCNGQHSIDELADRMTRLFDLDLELAQELVGQELKRFADRRIVDYAPRKAGRSGEKQEVECPTIPATP
jgi:anaerobic magnesium-protoporphyrin IX monomethyl ester cyclase